MLTGTDTILVLGTDERPKGSKEPGADTSDKGSRSDTIMLWRIGGGVSRRLSIPRDTVAQIPGYGVDEDQRRLLPTAGRRWRSRRSRSFTGIKINHLIIVNLANFPKFIDAIGGVDGQDGPDLLEHQRRRQERRLHAVPAARRHHLDRDPGADAGADARERVQRRQRPTSPARATSSRS